MPRARWFVVGFLAAAALVGGILNARGPFDQHPPLACEQFLANFEAGQVEQVVHWRERLEVTEGGGLFSVVVPADRDLPADLAQARRASGVGMSYRRIPDQWLGLFTPWVPVLILVAGALMWGGAIARNRRAPGRTGAGTPQPAR